jgi:hypothetical protein
MVIAHACFLIAILAMLFGNLTGESGITSNRTLPLNSGRERINIESLRLPNSKNLSMT